MRVALVCPYDWSAPGGVAHHVAHLARALAAEHAVTVVAPSSAAAPDPTPDLAVRVVGRPVGLRFNRSVAPVAVSPGAARRVLSELRDVAPDVCHVHEPFAPVVSATASAFGPRPLVGTFHAWSTRDRAYRAVGPAARRVAGRLAARLAVSAAAQEYAAVALHLPLSAFQVVPNGVDACRFAQARPLPELVDDDRPLVLCVGRLEARKGTDVAIRAFLRLRATDPSVRLCVVGDGPERRRCEEMVPHAVRRDVVFAGPVDARTLPRYHASATVFWAPATGGESFGIVLLEAMAAGLPVVASDLPGYAAVVADGREGRVVASGDAVALSDVTRTLLDSPALRHAMGTAGRRTAARHDWAVVSRRVAAVYRAVAGAA